MPLPPLAKDAPPLTAATVSSMPKPLAAYCKNCKKNFKYICIINVSHDQLINAEEQWM
jgi:hypothetical protein